MIEIDPKTTALLLVDLQVGVSAFPLAPHDADSVVDTAARLVQAFHAAGAPVVFVRTNYGKDNHLMVRVPNDTGFVFEPPEGWDVLDPRLGAAPDDAVVVKHVTSAFYGTDLDLQLRRRGVDTLVVGGVATHIGVESTAWGAYDRSYAQVFVEDAMSAITAEQHVQALANVFPVMGRIASAADVVSALGAAPAG